MRTIKNYNRAFKGVWIPAEIWLHPDLSIYEAVLLTEISSLDNENGCYASNEYFANFLGVTERSISEIISKLKELNLIEQTAFDGRNRVLKIKEGRKNFYSATTKVLPSIYNNTNINTNRDISKDISKTSTSTIIKRTSPTLSSLRLRIKQNLPIKQTKAIPNTTKEFEHLVYWNSLPNVRTILPNTSQYSIAQNMIKGFMRGKLMIKGKCVLTCTPFSDVQITEGLNRLATLFDKDNENYKFARSLGLMGLLYNINTERSWFMQMMTETSKDNSPYSAISKLICRKYNFNGNSAFRITNYLDEIANRYDKIPRNPDLYFTRGTDTYTFRGTQKKFIENFVEYVEKMQRVTIGVNLFDPNGWVFRKYVEDIVDAPNTYYANVPMSKWLLT